MGINFKYMVMKKLVYFFALWSVLLSGVSCDKDSDKDSAPVPLYVNTWAIEGNGEFGGADCCLYQFNADKTFNSGFVVNEKLLQTLKSQYLPPSDKLETDGNSRELPKEIIETIKSIKVNDVVTILKGLYVEIPGKGNDVYLSMFSIRNIEGMEYPVPMENELHLTNISKESMIIGNELSGEKPFTVKSLSSSGITVGKTVDLTELLGMY